LIGGRTEQADIRGTGKEPNNAEGVEKGRALKKVKKGTASLNGRKQKGTVIVKAPRGGGEKYLEANTRRRERSYKKSRRSVNDQRHGSQPRLWHRGISPAKKLEDTWGLTLEGAWGYFGTDFAFH